MTDPVFKVEGWYVGRRSRTAHLYAHLGLEGGPMKFGALCGKWLKYVYPAGDDVDRCDVCLDRWADDELQKSKLLLGGYE